VRPFSQSAEVHCRGYSVPLQRLITDFGADAPFGQISAKLQEHHGITVPISSAQAITERHAAQMLQIELGRLPDTMPNGAGVACIITEIDGSMIPIVTTAAKTDAAGAVVDRRTTRQIGWQEARLAFSRPATQTTPIFGVTMGSVDEAGAQLFATAIRVGVGALTFVHAVGDGAPWIADQVAEHFGPPGRYLLDFYHLCEYLAAASQICDPGNAKSWLTVQKRRLKRHHIAAVLKALQPFLEVDTIADNVASVRAADRYIRNRLTQLDYKGAIADKLPIGSGEIESAHRYVIQQRLKRAGTWWAIDNAKAMLALRVLRFNQDWTAYWRELNQTVA
jgi:Uncharacterised protein family (UPF0236)